MCTHLSLSTFQLREHFVLGDRCAEYEMDIQTKLDRYFTFSQLNLDKMDNNSVKSNDLVANNLCFHSTTLLNIARGPCTLRLRFVYVDLGLE